MLCPVCNTKLKTTNSRTNISGLRTWRRKHCQNCNLTLTSKEVLDLSPLISNQKLAPEFTYSKAKLNQQLMAFCSKSNQEFIDNILESIELNLLELSKKAQLNTVSYNSAILQVLEKLDQPAKLRYQANLSDS